MARSALKVKKRVELGEGHLWFFATEGRGWPYDAIQLLNVSGPGEYVTFDTVEVGAGDRVRLVVEVLE